MSQLTRRDSATRIIMASPDTIYEAYLSPEAIAKWRAPSGMRCHVLAFDAREGGTFRISLEYKNEQHDRPGKTSAHTDVVEGRFLELIPDNRIVELVKFESADPSFAGEMTVTTSLVQVPYATEVTIICENVPPAISPEDHQLGLKSTLENLAAYVE